MKKTRLVIAVLVLLLLAGTGAGVLIRQKKTGGRNFAVTAKIHHLKNTSVDLSKIDVRVYYFVPKDISGQLRQDWQKILEQAMTEIVQFHQSQFQDYSKLVYRLFPKPIIGRKTAAEYTKDDTPTEPKALELMLAEINQRVLGSSGDLHDKTFAAAVASAYPMTVLIVEGDLPKLQADGTSHDILGYGDEKNSAVVYLKIITDEPHRDYGTSIIYHEIAHNMGLDDQYDYQSLKPTSDDIMGSGRFRKLSHNYIKPETLRQLGVP